MSTSTVSASASSQPLPPSASASALSSPRRSSQASSSAAGGTSELRAEPEPREPHSEAQQESEPVSKASTLASTRAYTLSAITTTTSNTDMALVRPQPQACQPQPQRTGPEPDFAAATLMLSLSRGTRPPALALSSTSARPLSSSLFKGPTATTGSKNSPSLHSTAHPDAPPPTPTTACTFYGYSPLPLEKLQSPQSQSPKSQSPSPKSPRTPPLKPAFNVKVDSTPAGARHCHPESPGAIMQHLRAARERNERAILPSEAGTSDDEGTVSEKDKEKDRGTTRASDVTTGTTKATMTLTEFAEVLASPTPASSTSGFPLFRTTSMSSADSAGSTTALLPRVTAPVPPLRKVTPTASPPTRDLDLTKTALGAEHKSVLVKRNRKLEKVLGQALSEETVERFVVEPAVASSGSHGSCGSCGSHDNEGGDSTQSSHDVPEWMRHDIDPQLVPVPVDAGESTGSYRSRLRFGASASSTPPELKVYVSRVRHVAETRVGAGTVQPVRSATGRVMAKAAVSASPSATDTTTDTTAATTATKTTTAPAPTPTVLSPPLPSPHPSFSSANSSLDAEIKDARRIHRARRIQLAKLQRLLGAPISPALINSPHGSNEHLADQHVGMNRSASASGLRDWTARIRRSVSVTVRPRAAPVPGAAVVGEGATGMTVTVSPVAVLAALPSPTVPAPPSTPTTASAATTQTEDGRLDSTGLNDAQAVLARKRAIKLGRLFGDRPPPALYLPSVVSPTGATGPCSSSSSETVSGAGTGTGTGTGTRLAPSPVYASFAQSLSSLLYLAEHDAEGLALAMDEIDIEASESEEESGSENEVVTMEAALRDRASRRASAPPSSLLFPSVAKATLAPTPVPEAEAGATATAPKPKPKPAHTRHISLSTRKAFLANLFADPFGDAAAAANQTAQPAPAPETPNAHAFTHTTLSTPAQRTKASRHISRPSLHVALAPPTDVAREQAQASPLAPSFHGDGASIGAARASTVAPYTPASAAFSASSVPPTPGVPVSVASTPTTPFTRWQPIIAHAYSRAPPAPPVTPVTPVTPATPGTPATRSTPATPGTPASPAQAARRRETLDGVLRAMWSSVESEVGRGGVAPPERDALGSLMGELRRKGSEWAEV